MKKGLKRQIKQDELRTGLAQASAWVQKHGHELKIAAAILAVVALGVLGLVSFQRHRRAQGQEAFAAAQEIFEARLSTDPAASPPAPGPVFPTAAEKFRKAAAAFDGVERRFGSLPVALRARYYGALCRIELGEYVEAEKALREVAARRDEALESALARLALADIHRRKGELDKAVEAYRQIVDDQGAALPRDHALMNLASALEEARRLPEAGASYRRLAEEFPASVYAGEARRRAEYLKTASS